MDISAGIIFIKGNNIMLGHSTGNKHWDIPKGIINDGESPIAAAIRETKEETGIVVKEEFLRDLGEFKYRSDKKLHLFMCKELTPDVNDFKCESYFTHYSGKEMPEIDDLQWFLIDEAIEFKLAKNMKRVVKKIVYG